MGFTITDDMINNIDTNTLYDTFLDAFDTIVSMSPECIDNPCQPRIFKHINQCYIENPIYAVNRKKPYATMEMDIPLSNGKHVTATISRKGVEIENAWKVMIEHSEEVTPLRIVRIFVKNYMIDVNDYFEKHNEKIFANIPRAKLTTAGDPVWPAEWESDWMN